MKNKLKIGILSFYYPHLGGSGIITSRIASNLAKKGHEIHFIGYDTDIHPKDMEDLGIKLHRVRKIDYPCLRNEPYGWTLGSKIYNVHKKHNLDLVHANYAIPHALPAFIVREKLKLEGNYLPYIVTGHGSDIHTNGFKKDINPVLQLCLNQADALTFVSRDLKRISEEYLGINKNGIYIPNFVETDKFYKKPTDMRKKLNIPERAFVVGHVSNFTPIKQLYHFSYLTEHLKADDTLSNIYFIMCGDGRERAALEERVEKIGASDNFRFLGKMDLPGLVDVYNAMDVFMLPSKHEGTSLTLLEAMACEKPLIGTKVGGISEVIDEEVGFLFNSGKIEELSKIINTLKNNKELCHQIGENGLKRVREKYSVDKVMQEYCNLYESIVQNKRK